MIPASRADFKKYVLRKVGSPVMETNVADEQIEDRIDEALQLFWQFHFDGTERAYYSYQLTSDDITNRYITIPDNIIGVVKLFDMTFDNNNASNLFNVKYQMVMSELYALGGNLNVVPYYMTMQNIALIQEVLNGRTPIRYNRYRNRCHIDMDWSSVQVGSWIVLECYEIVDPETFTDVWSDLWLQNYTVALIEEQWGKHLTKYNGQMLGGISFNGQGILDRARADKAELYYQLIHTYSAPVIDMVG